MTSSDVMTTIYNHQSVICLLGMEINFRPLSIISFSFETQKIKLALFSSGVENIMWGVQKNYKTNFPHRCEALLEVWNPTSPP